jgi:hypothetical protein
MQRRILFLGVLDIDIYVCYIPHRVALLPVMSPTREWGFSVLCDAVPPQRTPTRRLTCDKARSAAHHLRGALITLPSKVSLTTVGSEHTK